MSESIRAVVIISADAEWAAAGPFMPAGESLMTPYGEAVFARQAIGPTEAGVVYLHGGWGKIAAAASAQYAVNRWQPELLVNLGTCGGFAGDIARGTTLLVDFTIVYDILEQMGDPELALAHYATEIDLSWLPKRLPHEVQRGMLISADRDIVAAQIPELRERFGAFAADWESGAIAYVARRNQVRCLILRVVSDLVSVEGGEAYGELGLFQERSGTIMGNLMQQLPDWLSVAFD